MIGSTSKHIKSTIFIILCLLLFGSCSNSSGFEYIKARQSNIDFNNYIPEDRTINILNFEYLYNGGGVGAADFNKDGKLDLYFTGNIVPNRLYLNQTGFNFKDITEASGTTAKGKWSNGVAIVDINGDTWPDIYVCVSALSSSAQPKNLLFINQGNNAEGIPTFIEEAEKYGLASTKHSRHAAFFDYDRDGDLDVYVLNNIIDLADPTSYRRKVTDGTATNNDQLYQNLGNNQYQEVSKAAGIVFEGYGLGLAIGDLNQDNWPDIYVANDYISNDLMYINQKDGTFRNEIADRTKLQSKFSMGVALSDFNNDGASDILVLDMLSATNDRLKRHVKESNYNNRKNNQFYKYQEQVPRNTLQLNHGQGQFGEIGLYSGIYASDWSWSPLSADFNNDGLVDVYVTNGFPKDITELDFVDYRAGANLALNKKKIFEKLIEEKVPNCLFLNKGNLQFEEQAKTWHVDKPSFSNGAIYADFDNNGQLDIVVNNINENAYLLKNQAPNQQNYIQIQFSESERYSKAIGSKVYVYSNGQQQFQEYHLNKAYLSSYSPFLHFGLGNKEMVDSIKIIKPTGEITLFKNIAVNQIFPIPPANSQLATRNPKPKTRNSQPATRTTQPIAHRSSRQDDFSYQRTLPIGYSQLGPVVATVDLDQNQQSEIIFIDEASDFIKIYHPQTQKIDTLKNLIEKGVNGLLVVDMNGDKLDDLVLTYGGYGIAQQDLPQSLQILLNDGKNGFQKKEQLSLAIGHALSVVRGNDVDKDGDIDLFLGGSIHQNNFPITNPSYLLLNEIATTNKIDKTNLQSLGDLGIVMDALWTDVSNNGEKDLMVAAHLKPIQVLSFNAGKVTAAEITKTGFWNSIHPLDYDNDGDMDYLVGNLGINTPLSNGQTSISITYQDQDKNGSVDVFTGFRFNSGKEEVPFEFRNEVIAQLPTLKKQFTDYQTFANSTFTDFIENTKQTDINRIVVETFRHQLLQQENGQLINIPLPKIAQLSPIYGWATSDFDQDNFSDVLASTNLSNSREFWGTYGALDGLFLSNQKDSTLFQSLPNAPRIKGDGRAIVSLLQGTQLQHYISMVNAPLEKIQLDCTNCYHYQAKPEEQSVLLTFKDGRQQKVEFYYGNGFRAQSPRGFIVSDSTQIAKMEIVK